MIGGSGATGHCCANIIGGLLRRALYSGIHEQQVQQFWLEAVAEVLSAKHNASMNPSDMARALGRLGGKARAARLTAPEKQRIAALGGMARSISLHAARRIAENFLYVDVMDALQPRPGVIRLRTLDEPLPDIHATKAHDV